MNIARGAAVTIEYCIKDGDGAVLDSSAAGGPLEYLHGRGGILSGLERALEGRAAGETFDAVIEPAEGFGVRDEALVSALPQEAFPAGAAIFPGAEFEAEDADGVSAPVRVTGVSGGMVTVDANHPLAGKRLFFTVTVLAVREARAEELENGLARPCCGERCGKCCDDGCCGG